ncbi:aminopeptidase P family protein [Bacteroidota bacterium]
MKKFIPFLIVLIVFPFHGCKEEVINQVIENEYPEQLTPYQTFYDAATFEQRRNVLMGEIPDYSIVVVTTNDIYLRSGDVDYDFRPSSAFYYLTGFEEPNAVAVIRKGILGGATSELIMFVDYREEGLVNWLGPVIGPQGAIDNYGADEAYVYYELETRLAGILSEENYQSIYCNLEDNDTFAEIFNNLNITLPALLDIKEITDEQRMIKSQIEITALERATDVTVQGFLTMMGMLEPGMYEYEVESIMDMVVGINGCRRTGFPTIVASGPNINYLHWPAGTRQMLDGDLVMIDFGAEYSYYSSDVTRTLPVNGRFTTQQAEVYQIVLDNHKEIISMIAPGVSYYDLYNLSTENLIDGLLEKGIISGNREDLIANRRQYIPAGLGHPVGLDTHDPFPADDNGDKILRENMVLAFEPHIYLYSEDQTVDPAYWECSARIEDVILVTSNGYRRLSEDLPYEIVEIEAFMNQ